MNLAPSVSAMSARLTKLIARSDAGYSVLELLITLALSAVVLGMSVGFYPQAVQIVRGDADLRIVYWELKLARDTAINQRRSVQVTFTAPNRITTTRLNIPNGTT